MKNKRIRMCVNGCGMPVETTDEVLCKACLAELDRKPKPAVKRRPWDERGWRPDPDRRDGL